MERLAAQSKLERCLNESSTLSDAIGRRKRSVCGMHYVDNSGIEKEFAYCPKHANRIALDMRIVGHDVFIDSTPIALPIEYDVSEFARDFTSKWQAAHEEVKRSRNEAHNVRPQNMPTKTKKTTKTTPKVDDNFQWI
jgi:hypothetical protein